MNDRAAWLAGRKTGIGGSDAAAIMGLNRYRTPLCECGCGLPVAKGKRFRHGHWAKKNGAEISAMKYIGRPSNHGDGYLTLDGRLEHILVAEKALGHALPPGAVVHHVDRNRSNNAPTNLVICPDQGYHALIHQRMRAMEACGHADWRKCAFCGQYDDPRNLYIPPRRGTIEHRACGRAYRAARLEALQC